MSKPEQSQRDRQPGMRALIFLLALSCGARSELPSGETEEPEPPRPCSTDDDCDGAICVENQCKRPCRKNPARLASSPGPTFVALGKREVFWVDPVASVLFKTSKLGGSITPLAPAIEPGGLAVDKERVYFADGNAIKSVSIDGGPVTTLASMSAPAWHVAIDASNVYWSSVPAGSPVARVSKQGGPPQFLSGAPDQDRSPLAVDANYVFWSDLQGIWRVTTQGVAAPLLLSPGASLGQPATGLVLDDAFAYSISCGIVLRANKAGSSSVFINNACTSAVGGLAIHANKLYFTVGGAMSNSLWGSPTPVLFSLPTAGGDPKVLMRSSAVGVAPSGAGIAVDKHCVYFAEQSDTPGVERGIWLVRR